MTASIVVQSFEDGDELVFHIASFGAQVVPLSPAMMEQTGEVASMELNMMSGLYRGEDEVFWVLDVTSVDPPLRNARLPKACVDLIGVKTSIELIKRMVSPA